MQFFRSFQSRADRTQPKHRYVVNYLELKLCWHSHRNTPVAAQWGFIGVLCSKHQSQAKSAHQKKLRALVCNKRVSKGEAKQGKRRGSVRRKDFVTYLLFVFLHLYTYEESPEACSDITRRIKHSSCWQWTCHAEFCMHTLMVCTLVEATDFTKISAPVTGTSTLYTTNVTALGKLWSCFVIDMCRTT